MPWNQSLAISYAQTHAMPASTGNCARYVREAIAAGGINVFPTHYAKDYGNSLVHAGFYVAVATTPLPGDVVVIQPIEGHPAGHMAIYDGHNWISDFKQYHGFLPKPVLPTNKAALQNLPAPIKWWKNEETDALRACLLGLPKLGICLQCSG